MTPTARPQYFQKLYCGVLKGKNKAFKMCVIWPIYVSKVEIIGIEKQQTPSVKQEKFYNLSC
jgi:hypothetical protein